MACSLNIFSCIEDINRVISALTEPTPVAEKQEKKDGVDKSEGKIVPRILRLFLHISIQH